MSEFDDHKAIVEHLRFRGIVRLLPMHIPNNPRDAKHGAHLQTLGMLKGAPDMVYPYYDGQILWHEIKSETGRLSHEQKDVHERLRQLGHKIIVTYGLNDALRQLHEEGIIR